ncbi:MAG: peptidyl-prolyl cis-trans isomerase [Myxococcales bacterium]|nr:peptidyl-prolyl cis-trans isomerase [Myxococcota bacterium]MDW8281534.1 peptidyl-prolyl cis-trans isomerase [Myxococcales bacterium]
MHMATRAPCLAWGFGLLLLLLAACQNTPTRSLASTRSDVLAQIDDVVITVADFQERINSQSPYVRARYTSLEHKKEFLENLIKFEILAKEAQRRGFDKDPEVVRTMKQVMIQKLLQQAFDKVRIEDITEAEIKAYFESHLSEFNKPPEVRVSMILVRDEATARKVLEDSRSKGLENAGFRELVAQYSIDAETRERGGDLRFFDADNRELPREIVEAAFKLQNIGDTSPAIKTRGGYAILKLTGQRKALVRTLDDVRQQIRSKLYRERRQKLMQEYEAELRAKAKVVVHPERLAKVVVDTSGGSDRGLQPAPGSFHPPGQAAPQASPAMPGRP